VVRLPGPRVLSDFVALEEGVFKVVDEPREKVAGPKDQVGGEEGASKVDLELGEGVFLHQSEQNGPQILAQFGGQPEEGDVE